MARMTFRGMALLTFVVLRQRQRDILSSRYDLYAFQRFVLRSLTGVQLAGENHLIDLFANRTSEFNETGFVGQRLNTNSLSLVVLLTCANA